MESLDINSRSNIESSRVLSNLYRKPFIMNELFFGSIEGFLQGLRVSNIDNQVKVFAMDGISAKNIGKLYPIDKNQTLFFKGVSFNRHSEKYVELYEKAYEWCFIQNETFQKSLYVTMDMELIHSIGKKDPFDTILTEGEFIGQLYRLRNKYSKFLHACFGK